MSKRIALKDFVEVDHVDLSNFASAVGLQSSHAQEDVSGFNETGQDEFLAGKTTRTVPVTFFGAYGANETHQVLWPLHRDRSVFPIKWRPDQTLPVSATNPELRGNAQLLDYNPGATRGSVDSFSVTFTAADADGFTYYET